MDLSTDQGPEGAACEQVECTAMEIKPAVPVETQAAAAAANSNEEGGVSGTSSLPVGSEPQKPIEPVVGSDAVASGSVDPAVRDVPPAKGGEGNGKENVSTPKNRPAAVDQGAPSKPARVRGRYAHLFD